MGVSHAASPCCAVGGLRLSVLGSPTWFCRHTWPMWATVHLECEKEAAQDDSDRTIRRIVNLCHQSNALAKTGPSLWAEAATGFVERRMNLFSD